MTQFPFYLAALGLVFAAGCGDAPAPEAETQVAEEFVWQTEQVADLKIIR